MTRVLLKGYYGFQNTGDDALFAAAAWGAPRSYGEHAALVAVGGGIPRFPGSGRVRPAYPAVRRWRGEARARVWFEALRSDAVVFGGGSVFHSSERLRDVELLLRLSGRGPHLAAGVSIGPFRSVADERACARVLRRLAFIGLRDGESAALARALAPGVPSALTFDLAPLLLAHADPAAGAGLPRRGVGLALCDYERYTGGDERREAARRARVVEVMRALGRSGVDELVLVDFNGDRRFGDARIHAEVRAACGDLAIPVRHVAYDPAPLAVLQTVAGLRAMVAMRLHAAVFGFLARTPTVILAYHPKCLGWAVEAGVAPSMVHDSAEFDPSAVVSAVTLALAGRAPAPALPVAAAVDRAKLNFPALAR